MADNELAEAIEIVARTAIAQCVDTELRDGLWEMYPEIGESDWTEIESQMEAIANANHPGHEQFAAAYEYLSGRAGGDA